MHLTHISDEIFSKTMRSLFIIAGQYLNVPEKSGPQENVKGPTFPRKSGGLY